MSIRIQKSKCAGCGRCIEACPGNLIKKDKENKAVSYTHLTLPTT